MSLLPRVRPTQLHGIEVNSYAQQLAQVVIWIGYLQWMHHNGFSPPRDPVLEPIESIELRDAILDLSNPEHPTEPEWPAADVIVGNPPFLGGKLLRTHLGDEYIDTLFQVWNGRVPREADICCYWFEKGRDMIARKKVSRVGLLATQGIRGGANRRVLQSISSPLKNSEIVTRSVSEAQVSRGIRRSQLPRSRFGLLFNGLLGNPETFFSPRVIARGFSKGRTCM